MDTKLLRTVLVILPAIFAGAFVLHTTSAGSNDVDKAARAAADSLRAVQVADSLNADPLAAFVAAPLNLHKLPALPLKVIDTETLWLARCIYSETKQAKEQELVAWVVRNRVETGYRGRRSYRATVLDPYQFSAFNPGTRKQRYYSSLDPQDGALGWERALAIAYYVRHAPESVRPFSMHTRHFYSEQSMANQSHPHPTWAAGQTPVAINRDYSIDQRRFRFFAGIS